MLLGLNQNITYKGETYHIQTEDGGRKNPVITTLLFRSGTILASKRTEYADILKYDKLDMVVKEMMDEQHAELMDALKSGRFDKVGRPKAYGAMAETEAEEETTPPAETAPQEAPPPKAPPQAQNEGAVEEKSKAPGLDEKSLDDLILERLGLGK
jgi:translation elongation factor EF-Tu-like GTPase